VPLFLDKNSESLRVLMQLRDEAHRFGITHHRKKRTGAMLETELAAIKGVGEKSIEKLLLEWHSISRIKAASLAQLAALVGKKAALAIKAHFEETD
jgi:excinuclease ABC subunit C